MGGDFRDKRGRLPCPPPSQPLPPNATIHASPSVLSRSVPAPLRRPLQFRNKTAGACSVQHLPREGVRSSPASSVLEGGGCYRTAMERRTPLGKRWQSAQRRAPHVGLRREGVAPWRLVTAQAARPPWTALADEFLNESTAEGGKWLSL